MSDKEINEIISRNISRYLDLRGYTQVEFADLMDVSSATVSNWCNGVKVPRMDKLDKICELLHITRNELMSIEEPYYLDEDAREYAEFLFKNPEYKVLFDASRKVPKEDIEFVRKMIDRMRGGGNDDTGC